MKSKKKRKKYSPFHQFIVSQNNHCDFIVDPVKFNSRLLILDPVGKSTDHERVSFTIPNRQYTFIVPSL